MVLTADPLNTLGSWPGGWQQWQDWGDQTFEVESNPIVPVDGWGRIRGKENMVPNGTRAQAKGMAGEHLLVEVDGQELWVEAAAFSFNAPLLERSWTQIAPGQADWRLMSWNVLADGLAQQQFTDRSDVLDWSVRRERLLEEVDRVRPDVLGLSEANHFPEWRAALASRGYHGTFVPKPKSPCLRYGAPADGCALFVSGRFDTVENLSFTFHKSNQVCVALLLRDRVLQLDCVVAVVHFKSGGSEADEARLAQVKELLKRAGDWQKAVAYTLPIILAGDFNEPPGSNVSKELEAHAYKDLYRPLDLSFTAMDYTWGWEGIIDFIFGKHVRAKRAFNLPSREEIGAQGIPNERYPSDHFALALDVAFDPEMRMLDNI
jgi:mRNA deadenylase 3'-5' endonuclease subunit Ccr4